MFLQYAEQYDFNQADDRESIASLETDDGEDHPPEKIIAETTTKSGHTWYLVTWKDCPVIRSSWEGKELFDDCPEVWDAWLVEKQQQAEGKSKPLDIEAFNKAVRDLEVTETQRRVLRRLRREVRLALSTLET
ncbi:hypothetical protein L207DRAFT_425771 [Hyaloscypha variabilis F]|uniref:Chromo domain-containing protein n=1 Tax=Hyaloscypha variabilis (strain UAMH 11265 / GT02V1 / F) TaxID=1149755 RepID=A0A2J6RT55_HYAVF|nr:hypothetical protein L207DRAFT_425771 [Hyaloscypha variabilis F]